MLREGKTTIGKFNVETQGLLFSFFFHFQIKVKYQASSYLASSDSQNVLKQKFYN